MLFLVAVQTVFVLGLALVLASASVYFRDLQHLLGIVLQVLVLLGADRLPDEPRDEASSARPGGRSPSTSSTRSYAFVEAYRDVLYDLRFPPLDARGLPDRRLVRRPRRRHGGLRPARGPAGGGAVSRTVVRVDDVSKRFRLYHERNQSLKAAVMRRGRATYEEFWALRDVSLRGRRRAPRSASIGHNGSGKSTHAQVPGQDPAARRGLDRRSRARCRRCSSSAPASTPSCRAARTSTSTAPSSA